MRWCSPADAMVYAGAMWPPIVPCRLSRPIGGCGDTSGERAAANLLTKDEARRMAANLAKLPECLRRKGQRSLQ